MRATPGNELFHLMLIRSRRPKHRFELLAMRCAILSTDGVFAITARMLILLPCEGFQDRAYFLRY